MHSPDKSPYISNGLSYNFSKWFLLVFRSVIEYKECDWFGLLEYNFWNNNGGEFGENVDSFVTMWDSCIITKEG